MARPDLPKVTPPQLDRVVPRPRVQAALAECLKRAAVWVHAAGGSGKTTAVAMMAASLGRPVVWMHLDAGDGETATFFRYLTAAAARAIPRAGGKLPVHAPELDAELALFTRRYARALAALAPGAALVFDNAQDLPSASPVREAIATLCEELAGHWAVVVASREAPAAVHAQLASSGRLEILPASLFDFTEDELKEVLRRRGILEEKRLAALATASRGWIAGALLLALQPADAVRAEWAGPGGDESLLFGYFGRQLLARLDDGDRSLLLATAFLDTVSAKAAARLAGIAEAAQRLAAIASQGLFTVRLEGAEPSFRYHDLFRDFLRAECARSRAPEALAALKRATAAEMAAMGEPLPALQLLADCAAWDDFERLAPREAERILEQGHARAFADVLQRLPAADLERNPWLLYWLGQCHVTTSDEAAAACLAKAYALFESRGDRAGQLVAAVDLPSLILNQLNRSTGYEAWIGRLEILADEAPAITSPYLSLKVHGGLLGSVLVSATLGARLDELVAGLVERVPKVADANLQLQALAHVASIAWRFRRGDLAPPVIELAQRLRLEEKASPLVVLHWLYDLITYDCMYGDARRARECGERAECVAEATGLAHAMFEALVLRLEAACDANQIALARALQQRLAKHVDPARPFTVAAIHAFAARIALLADDAAGALREGREAVAALDVSGHPRGLRSAYYMIECGAHVLAGDWDAALAAGERYRPDFKPRVQALVDVNAAWIVAAGALSRGEPEAKALLASAAALARENDYPHYLRHANAAAARLSAQALAWDIEPAFIRAAIARRGMVPPDPLSPEWPWKVAIRCLGPFEIARDGEPMASVGKQQKTLALLQALVALGGRDVPASRLIELLWPGEGRVGAQQAFDTTLHRLRKLLDSDDAIAFEDRRLSVDRDRVWVDSLALEARLAALATNPPADWACALRPIVELYRGHLLASLTEAPWALAARERLWARMREALLKGAGTLAAAGRGHDARDLHHFLFDLDPASEEAAEALIRQLASEGRRADAMRTFRRCEAALRAELDLAPSAGLRGLAEGLRD